MQHSLLCKRAWGSCFLLSHAGRGALLLLALLLGPLGGAWGQSVGNYAVTRSTGNTYPTLVTYNNFTWRNGTSTDDNLSTATNIGFTFVYDGVPYTQFSASTNGFLTFGVV